MITDDQIARVELAREQTRNLAEEAALFKIDDNDALIVASSVLQDVAAQRKALEAEHKKICEPSKRAAKETKAAADALFRDALDDLRTAEQVLRRQIAAYHDQLQVERNRALREAASTGTVVAPAPVVEIAGVTTRTYWHWRVTDPDTVPREYLTIDDAKIGAIVRRDKDKTSIPGIEAYSETGLAVGRKP